MKDKNGKNMTAISQDHEKRISRTFSQSNTANGIFPTNISWVLYFLCLGFIFCATSTFLPNGQFVISISGILLVLAAIICCVTATVLTSNRTTNRAR